MCSHTFLARKVPSCLQNKHGGFALGYARSTDKILHVSSEADPGGCESSCHRSGIVFHSVESQNCKSSSSTLEPQIIISLHRFPALRKEIKTEVREPGARLQITAKYCHPLSFCGVGFFLSVLDFNYFFSVDGKFSFGSRAPDKILHAPL